MPSRSKLTKCPRCGRERQTNHSRVTPDMCVECRSTADDEGQQAWMARANCRVERGHDPDWWYPTANNDSCIQIALAECATCPVADECLDFALETRQAYGIWGGLEAYQRVSILRSRRRRAV